MVVVSLQFPLTLANQLKVNSLGLGPNHVDRGRDLEHFTLNFLDLPTPLTQSICCG